MAFNSILNSDASAIRRRSNVPQPKRPASAGFTLDGVLTRIDEIEQSGGPLAGEFARSYIESQFRQRGFPLNLKSASERQLEERQSALAAAQLADLERGRVVRDTIGTLLDSANVAMGDLVGGQYEGDTRTLQDFLGTRLDASIMQRPEDLIKASRALVTILNPGSDEESVKTRNQFALRHSDLLLNEFTAPFAKQTTEERGAESAARQRKAWSDLEENTENQAELQAGEGVVSETFEQRLEAAGEAIGQDLSPGGFDDDFDEAQGSAAVAETFLLQAEDFAEKGLPREAMLGLLLGDAGQRIGSVLRGGRVEQGEDGRRILRIDGGVFNDPQAVSNYIGLIDKFSEVTGRTRKEILRLMALDFDDFAEEDIGQARESLGLR